MGRQLERQDSDIEFKNFHPGCMWGILHILDYHHRHHVKKMQPRGRRRFVRGKRAICCGNPKTVSFDRFPDEVHEYLDADAVPLLVEQQTAETSPAYKQSSNAHMKALQDKDMSARSPLQKTNSLHHLKTSDHQIGARSTSWENPIIILHKSVDHAGSRLQVPTLQKDPEKQLAHNNNCHLHDTVNANGHLKQNQIASEHSFSSEMLDNSADASSNQNLSGDKQLKRDISCPQFNYVDVLEIFKVNKKLVVEIQEDSVNAKAKLRKSGTFPAAVSSQIVRPSTLEHKQMEFWTFSKGQNLFSGVEAPKYAAAESLKDPNVKSIVLRPDDTLGAGISQGRGFPPSALSQGQIRHGWHHWHHTLKARVNYIKKKIKHALREIKKENYNTSRYVLDHNVPSGSNISNIEKDIPNRVEEIAMDQYDAETMKNIHYKDPNYFNKAGQSHIRRTSSLNESLERYSQLFEYTLSRETKWHQYQSKSLKLTNEDKVPASGHGLKSYRRRLSLPDIDWLSSFSNEISHESLSSEMPIRNAAYAEGKGHNKSKSSSSLEDRKQFDPPDAFEESELQKQSLQRGKRSDINEYSGSVVVDNTERTIEMEAVSEELVEPENLEQRPQQHAEVSSLIDVNREQETGNHLQQDTTDFTELSVSQRNSKSDSRHIGIEELDSTVNLQARDDKDLSGALYATTNDESANNASMFVDDIYLASDSNRLDNADFNYVRDVLEVSGLLEKDSLGKWHSLDHPINPTLFKRLEAYIHQDSSFEDAYYNCNHRFLFDLINEELLKIYESSLAYFPKPFSFATKHVNLVPKADHVLQEVWKGIKGYQNSCSEELSLDDLVGRDLGKGDGWMNLLFDVEDVALDLEDIIFDQLLDEAICQ